MSDISYLEPVQLTSGVQRITAKNPGAMTGPGTNTYVIGKEKLAIVDPGPLIEEHVDAILKYFGNRIYWVIVTHTHKDHSPAAAMLASETGARLVGNVIENDGFQDPTFVGAKPLEHNQMIETDTRRIRAILTPGHVANHVCYLVENDSLLITGDHMMEGSTVVIVPPAGDMKKYIDSLDSLLSYSFNYVAPGHGTIIKNPKQEVKRLIEHRLKRESKVIEKLLSNGGGNLRQLTPLVYDDVDPSLHRWASMSLHAHLIKLKDDDIVSEENDNWSLNTI